MTAYRVRAYNTAHASENKIHDDAVAQRLGFSGALVPGVEMYAYMMHLPVERWGRTFLERGTAECRFTQPVYDGEIAEVAGREDGGVLSFDLLSRGVSCATGSASLPADSGEAPALDRYPPNATPLAESRPAANPGSLAVGNALSSFPLHADATAVDAYLRDVRETDALYSREKLVHPGMVLRMCNRALLESVKLGPWIHVGSKVRNFSAARVGETLIAHSRVTANYERKGHLFIDLDVLVLSEGTRPVARVLHTAIYRPRQLAA